MRFASLAVIAVTVALAGAAFVWAQGSGETGSDADCVKTHGYWKNHEDDWPVDNLTLGQHSYEQDELVDLLRAPPRGDASLILAHQLIAAKLNVEAGADPASVEGTLEDADALLFQYDERLPLDVRASSDDGQQMVSIGQSLDGFNNGRYGDACPTVPPSDDEDGKDEDEGDDHGDDQDEDEGEDEGDDEGEEEEPEPTACPTPKPAPNATDNETVDNPCPGDVAVRKVTDQSEFKVAFNLSVDSLGPNKARQVVLTDSLPDLDHDWRLKGTDADDCTLSALELRCDFGNLSAGETRSVRVWSPYCPEECGEDLVNTARVNASNDANATNNEASSTIDVPDCPEPEQDGDVALAKSANAMLGNGTGDDEVVFEFEVESLGPATATNVTLHDELPDLGGTYNVTGEAADACTLEAFVLHCDLGDLAAGDARSVRVESLDSELGCGDDVVNNATVSADNDANASNDGASATLERDDCPVSDVGVNKTGNATDRPEEMKDTVSFTTVVSSLGTANATNVTLVDELPELEDDHHGWTLSGDAADDCVLVNRTVTCTFGTLAPGENRTLVVSALQCEIGCGADLVNTAVVSADQDADSSNNEAAAVIERVDCPEPEPEPAPEPTSSSTSTNGSA